MTATSDWFSMASAPKDGSSLLLAYEVDYGFEVTIGWFDDAWRGFEHAYSDMVQVIEPTHWRPLPAPPTMGSGVQDRE